MGSQDPKKVGSFAFYSRILVILMQAFFNYLMPDHKADVFNPPSPHPMTIWDDIIRLLLEGFRRWDGIYFIHIAEYGYTYENTLAFFPIFPMIIAILANTVFFPLQYIMNYQSVLMIAAAVMNVIIFVQSAKILYYLGLKVLGDETLAYKAVQLYCINPASIFFSAAYSESTFALLSFCGMSYVEDGSLLKAALVFGLSSGTRSNGIANAGFVLYKKFIELFERLGALQKSQNNDLKMLAASLLTLVMSMLWSSLFLLTACILPFVVYQFISYELYCQHGAESLPEHVIRYGNEQKYRMPLSGTPSWCFQTLPFSYFHIQSGHWGNGFLKYYEMKQIPNFLLATPMVAICLFGAAMYIGRNTKYCITLGLSDPRDSAHKKSDEFLEQGEGDYTEVGFFNKKCYIYTMHMLCMVVIGILFMHVQVITRMIASSCPVLYWFIAHIGISQEQLQALRQKACHPVEESDQSPPQEANRSHDDLSDWDSHCLVKAIFIYFHLYLFVGVAAFSNFLPWT